MSEVLTLVRPVRWFDELWCRRVFHETVRESEAKLAVGSQLTLNEIRELPRKGDVGVVDCEDTGRVLRFEVTHVMQGGFDGVQVGWQLVALRELNRYAAKIDPPIEPLGVERAHEDLANERLAALVETLGKLAVKREIEEGRWRESGDHDFAGELDRAGARVEELGRLLENHEERLKRLADWEVATNARINDLIRQGGEQERMLGAMGEQLYGDAPPPPVIRELARRVSDVEEQLGDPKPSTVAGLKGLADEHNRLLKRVEKLEGPATADGADPEARLRYAEGRLKRLDSWEAATNTWIFKLLDRVSDLEGQLRDHVNEVPHGQWGGA